MHLMGSVRFMGTGGWCMENVLPIVSVPANHPQAGRCMDGCAVTPQTQSCMGWQLMQRTGLAGLILWHLSSACNCPPGTGVNCKLRVG